MNPNPNQRYRQLSDALVLLRDGQINDEAGRALNSAIAATEATGKPATLTLTIKVSMAAKGSEMVKVEADVKAKLPESDRAPSLFYVDENHNLSLDNPAAAKRGPVRTVDESVSVVKEVSNG